MEPSEPRATATGKSGKLTVLLHDDSIRGHPWHIPKELIDACLTGDVLLVCKDNKAIQCHSQILAVSCDVLRGMFDGTSVCKAATPDNPARIHMTDDIAEHWLYVLMYLYPIFRDSPTANAHTAAALAILGHKYNIVRVLSAWEKFAQLISDKDPSTGHIKWLIHNWEDEELSGRDEVFRAGGVQFSVNLFTKGPDPPTHLRLHVYKHPNIPEPSSTNRPVTFKAMILDQCLPWNGHIRTLQPHSANYFICEDFMEYAHFKDVHKGFVRDDTVELRMLVQVDDAVESSDRPIEPILSGVPGHPMYVFKWWDLAKKVQDCELELKCYHFVTQNMFHALFEEQFRKDLHANLVGMGPEVSMKLMYDMRL